MDRKEKRILTVSSFIFFLMVIGIAYAYYADKINLSPANAIIKVKNDLPIFISYSDGDLNLNVPLQLLTEASTTPVATDSSNYVVSLVSFEEGKEAHCNYDLQMDFSMNKNNSSVYTPVQNYNYELSLKATRTTTGDTTGHVYLDKNISEFELTQLCTSRTCSNRSIVLMDNAEIYSKSKTATKTFWNFQINYYSVPKTQNVISFNAIISAVNITCT